MSERKTGRISVLRSKFTMGYIKDESGNEWWLHFKALRSEMDRLGIVVGSRVEFTPGELPEHRTKGVPNALDVVVLKEFA